MEKISGEGAGLINIALSEARRFSAIAKVCNGLPMAKAEIGAFVPYAGGMSCAAVVIAPVTNKTRESRRFRAEKHGDFTV
jgi:hypothetical protein